MDIYDDDTKEYLEKNGIKIEGSLEEIWHRGAISYFDFFTVEGEHGALIYKVVIPKGTPMQLYLARTYPDDPNLQITEDEILESESAEDLITSLNSIGYDVVEIPADYYEIYPTDSKVTWTDKKGHRAIVEGWEANKMTREEYKGEYVTSKGITYEKRKELEPTMDKIVQRRENNSNKKLN